MAPLFRHGKGTFFSITSATGGTINLSSGIDSASLARSLDTAEVTHFQQNDKVYIPGLRDHTFSVSGHFSSTHTAKLDALIGSTSGGAYVYGPDGSTAAGRRKYTGSALVTGLTYDTPVGDKVSMSIDLQGSGAVTAGVFP